MNRKLGFASASILAVLWLLTPFVSAQIGAPGRNVHPEARPENDRGRVADRLPMQHMLLQLRRSTERQAALERYIGELESQGSPNFHRWLTAQEFGAKFGVPSSDLEAVTAWLRAEGFQVNVVYPSGMLVDFSGT